MYPKKLSTLLCALALWMPDTTQAIYVGNMTFSMPADKTHLSKYIVNNNSEARLYRVIVKGIDTPGANETSLSLADGELLFTPRQITLQPGQGDYFKFHYHGLRDNIERYYRVSFEEIPPLNRVASLGEKGEISLMPVVKLDTILVVRPREINFKWYYNPERKILSNTGNTWFKLLLKPSCDANEDESENWYMRPGDTLNLPADRAPQTMLITYDERFIKIFDKCT